MEKLMVTHRLSLDMNSQAVQATITLAQGDTATHRLIVTLRHGAEVVELPPGSYAVAVQDSDINSDDKIDELDSVTVYGPDSSFPNCIVYDVSEAVTGTAGYHEAQFLITYVDEDGVMRSLSSPRIAFVIKPDILRSSDVKNSQSYKAVVEAQKKAKTAQAAAEAAQAAAEIAKDEAVTAKEAAETAQGKAEAVGVVSLVTVRDDGKLEFTFKDGRTVVSDKSVIGEQGELGDDYVLTDDDKAEIADIVLASLPEAEEASF